MCILSVDWRLVLLCIRVSDSDLFTVLVLLDLSGFDWFFFSLSGGGTRSHRSPLWVDQTSKRKLSYGIEQDLLSRPQFVAPLWGLSSNFLCGDVLILCGLHSSPLRVEAYFCCSNALCLLFDCSECTFAFEICFANACDDVVDLQWRSLFTSAVAACFVRFT